MACGGFEAGPPDGLCLDQMSEPAPAEQWSRSRPGADRVPVYLAARCLKEAVPAQF